MKKLFVILLLCFAWKISWADKLYFHQGGMMRGELLLLDSESKTVIFQDNKQQVHELPLSRIQNIRYLDATKSGEQYSSKTFQKSVYHQQEIYRFSKSEYTDFSQPRSDSVSVLLGSIEYKLKRLNTDEKIDGHRARSLAVFISGQHLFNRYIGAEYGGYTGRIARVEYSKKSDSSLAGHTPYDLVTVYGFLAGAKFGHNLRDKGFNIHANAGLYTERLHLSQVSGGTNIDHIHGYYLGGAFGWNFTSGSLSYSLRIKNGSSEDFAGANSLAGIDFTYFFN